MGSQAPENLLHFLLVPLMSQSHLIPFTDMARQLANRGPLVTILLTPLNAHRYKSVAEDNLGIQFLVLPLPCKAAGLPDGCENMDSLPSSEYVMNFFEASNMMDQPLVEWLERAEPKPNCIVSDICFPWTADVATRFNIPRIIFYGISCFTTLCSHNIRKHKIVERLSSEYETFRVPDMPDEIEFTRAQLPELSHVKNKNYEEDEGEDGLEDFVEKFKAAELSADGVIVNSFEELEPNYVKGYQKVVKKLWCIGPVSLSKKPAEFDDNHCLKWLDSRSPSSVLYVCFGSLCRIQAAQLIELALGLESSGCSFVWVIRKGDYSLELDDWFLEEKFEERVQDRGIIIRGWAPQVRILAHPAIAGFMTHCGWNSTQEGVSAGVPMIAWPMFAEQFYNEKLIVQVARTGVRVGGAEMCTRWGDEEAVDQAMVMREDVRRAIERLMDEGEEGKERRRRAKKLGEMARKAVENGGSSYLNMTLMIQHVSDILSGNCLVGAY